ncbi:MAG TPA: hypothetical protein VH092_25440 [Urbifossiella sp.]|jgi:hypothetical protein|nr:hypothetical protein [Urbifossiella sp.]
MAPSPPWPEPAYRFDLPNPVPADFRRLAAAVFPRVWRAALDRPGFALIRFGGPVASPALRHFLLDLAGALPLPFVPERLGRFDQQVSSRFHRDGAPPASLLLLGYEGSRVRSRVFAADAERAAAAAGLPVNEYLAAYNPMTPAGEAKLWPVATELAVPVNEPFVVVLNNSLVPAGPDRVLGVLHKAEVHEPDPTAERVINSVGLMRVGDPAGLPKPTDAVAHFLDRADLD